MARQLTLVPSLAASWLTATLLAPVQRQHRRPNRHHSTTLTNSTPLIDGKFTQITHTNDAFFTQLKLSHGEYVHFKSKDGTPSLWLPL